MARLTQSLLVTMPTLVKILKEHHDSNLAQVERMTKMLDEKEVALVKQAKEADQWVLREADLQAQLKIANDLLL